MIDRFEIVVLGVCVAIGLGCVVVRADEPQTWNHFGVIVTQSDVAIKEMYGLCMLHPPVMKQDPIAGKQVIVENGDWWPNPCNEVQAKFRDSGAQAKWEEIEKRDKANQLDMVKRGLGLAK